MWALVGPPKKVAWKDLDMKIISWNLNSITTRRTDLLELCQRESPEIVLLQELKVENAFFPHTTFNDIGYQAYVLGQKQYNGVAILVKNDAIPDTVEEIALPPFEKDARLLSARFGKLLCYTVYAPNGEAYGSEKWHAKLAWYRALTEHLETKRKAGFIILLGGDFNIAPGPEDAFYSCQDTEVLCSTEEREALKALMGHTLVDAAKLYPERTHSYTWWDYRLRSFENDHGCRIDLFLLSAPAAALVRHVDVDQSWRAREKPSDHAPVFVEFLKDIRKVWREPIQDESSSPR